MNKKIFLKSIICVLLALIIIGASKRYVANKKCIVPRQMNELINQGLYDKAIEIGKKELEQDPKNYLIYSVIGNAYIHKKEYDIALENFKTSLELNKNNFSTSYFYTYIEIALCYRAKDMYEEAIKILKYVIDQKSKSSSIKEQAYKLLIEIYIKKGMIREAALAGLQKEGVNNPSEELMQGAIKIVEREYEKYKDMKNDKQ